MEQNKLFESVENFIKCQTSNPYYEATSQKQLIEDLHQTGKLIDAQMKILSESLTEKRGAMERVVNILRKSLISKEASIEKMRQIK